MPDSFACLSALAKPLIVFFCSALILTFAGNVSAQTISVRDDEGSQIILQKPAGKILSLAPALTELLFSIDAGDRIHGVVEFSNFPEAALAIPVVGSHDRLDIERILQIDPELILAWGSGSPRSSVARLKEMGYQVFMAEAQSLQDIPPLLERLGKLTGKESTANLVATNFKNRYTRLQTEYSNKEKVSTFYQIWNAPVISVGGDELINNIMELCGAENIFADIQLKAPKISEESVLARNPTAIVASGADEQRPQWLDDWKSWSNLTAVTEDNLFFVPPDLVMRPTLRALDGADMLCRQIDSAR